jgi:YidC/Oxa1 family membrane protein insertase
VHLLLAASWLDPIVAFLYSNVLLTIDKPIHNLGWSMVILAALIRLVFWPLNTAQFKSMMKMQKIAPLMKRLQDRYKDDRQKLQQETMALYKEHRVNPFAGCWPMLVQYPVIIAVYWVVINHRTAFENQTWVWIGSAISQAAANVKVFGSPILAASLGHADLLLVLLYALSMYLSVRYVSVPATDPQQAQMQRNMAIFSPLLLGFMGWKYQWPSAMVLYWFSYNVLTMAQQFYLLRRYHQPLALIDSEHVITADVSGGGDQKRLPGKTAPSGNGVAQANPARSGRGTRSKRKNKKA